MAAATTTATSATTPSLPTPRSKPKFLRFTNTNRIKFRLRRSYRALAGQVESPSGTERPVDDEDTIRRLQNGPDVRGVALEGEKGRIVDFTPGAVDAIAESFGEWVVENLRLDGYGGEVRVSMGRDPRVSGPRLSTAVFGGLVRAGCKVFDMGLATTPACFMSTVLHQFDYDASIMVGQLSSFFLSCKMGC